MEEGAKLLDELIDYASAFEREPISASKLIVGMKCGGSDGFSGITANPLVGSWSVAKALAEDYFEAEKAWLEGWK